MKIYHENYRTIYLANSGDPLLSYLTSLILKELDPHKGTNVLELGCGTGRTSIAAARQGFQVTGLDFNDKALEIAKSESKRLDIQGNVTFSKQDITAIRRGVYRGFDYCVISEVIEHVKDPRKVIQAGMNSLKSGGILILTTPNSMKQWNILDDYAEHNHRFTTAEISTLFEGYHIRKITTLGYPLMRSLIYLYTRYLKIFRIPHRPASYRNNKILAGLYNIIGTVFLNFDSMWDTQWGNTIFAVVIK